MAIPFDKTVVQPWATGGRKYYKFQKGFTKGDHDTPLPYTLTFRESKSKSQGADPDVANLGAALPTAVRQMMTNTAYSKFKYFTLGTQSQIGAAIGEWKKSLSMVRQRALQGAMIMKHLRKKRVDLALIAALDPTPGPTRPNKKAAAESIANQRLEMEFGWRPLVGDITSAIEQLSEPLPSGTNSGKASQMLYQRVVGGGRVYTTLGTSRIRVGGRVTLTNPNLFLFNELGLTNPASVLFELAPWSFLLDWQYDISSFLDSFTDFIGCKVDQSYQTYSQKWNMSVKESSTGKQWAVRGADMQRGLGLPRPIPNLDVLANIGRNIERAYNAMALFTQQTKKLGQLSHGKTPPRKKPKGW